MYVFDRTVFVAFEMMYKHGDIEEHPMWRFILCILAIAFCAQTAFAEPSTPKLGGDACNDARTIAFDENGMSVWEGESFDNIKKERHIVKELGAILRPRIKQLLASDLFSWKEKFFLTVFILSPHLDRLHRFYREPSLKKYEQIQKASLADKSVESAA